MINADAVPPLNNLRVVFKFPDISSLDISVPGNGAALYITNKLKTWISQRMYRSGAKCTIEAAKLIVLLSYYENLPLFALCDLVAGNRAAIAALAPADGSAAYESTVLPILNFCTLVAESNLEKGEQL